ncbi:hypothetical protein ACWEN3_45600, partial [Streptomyces sp. NPDC004561]
LPARAGRQRPAGGPRGPGGVRRSAEPGVRGGRRAGSGAGRESTAAATEGRLRADWVRSRLAAGGFTGELDSVAALKALRQAEPQLSLLAAVQLQREALANPE